MSEQVLTPNGAVVEVEVGGMAEITVLDSLSVELRGGEAATAA